jgi:CheY-specific phosphatase CheX
MMEKLTTVMTTSISEVMETMFYTPVEFGEDSVLSKSGLANTKPNKVSQLKFNGDFSGSLTLAVPEELLIEVTENFMGEPRESLEDEHIMGTLTEMLNMICGNALSKMDPKVPFNLEIPTVIDEDKIPDTQIFTIVETTSLMMAINIAVD